MASAMNAATHLFFGPPPGAQLPSASGKYNRSDMVNVWERTQVDCQKGHYDFGKHRIQLEPFLSKCAKNTVKKTWSIWRRIIEFFRGFFCSKTYKSRGYDTRITVENRDAIEVAIRLKEGGLNPVLLNPANAKNPGGGYKTGARAMEEDICRRSGLAFAIDKTHKKQPTNFYPLKGSELLYTPDVPIFRQGSNNHYAYMKKPALISIISSAAINRGRSGVKVSDKVFEKETESRIYEQLAMAADQGHDAPVLTAFGCGAFKNHPKVVSRIYKKVLDTHFKGVFKEVKFAVIDDHNNRHGNFKTFKKTFQPRATT